MIVGVVSDTHLPRFGRRLPDALRAGLREHAVDLVLHLGDFTSPGVPDLFAEIAPFDAVAGNNDGDELRERFGRRKVLELDGVRVGLVHGDGERGTTPQRAEQAFARDAVDVVLFGHSHIPLCAQRPDGRWLVNPGSPTDKRRNPLFSYATLELRAGGVAPFLHFYGDRSSSGGAALDM